MEKELLWETGGAVFMQVESISKFERFFRVSASLDIDKNDLKRYSEFIDKKVNDLLIIAQAAAKANNRDIIAPWDLPITKGLQESIHKYREIEKELGIRSVFERNTGWPPLDRLPDDETQARLPDIMGGLSLALARSFKIIWPDLKNPESQHWDCIYQIFDQLL